MLFVVYLSCWFNSINYFDHFFDGKHHEIEGLALFNRISGRDEDYQVCS